MAIEPNLAAVIVAAIGGVVSPIVVYILSVLNKRTSETSNMVSELKDRMMKGGNVAVEAAKVATENVLERRERNQKELVGKMTQIIDMLSSLREDLGK
ncbi:MAG: hypothetical protein ACREBU_20270 [Nitrososphaera sp.]